MHGNNSGLGEGRFMLGRKRLGAAYIIGVAAAIVQDEKNLDLFAVRSQQVDFHGEWETRAQC